jgi:NAD(P)H-hydrate epimerase
MSIPDVTSVQMAEIDRRMKEDYQIDLLSQMENAGKSLAIQTRRLVRRIQARKILVMAGKGGNGGGGLVCARHVHNWGANVTVVLSSPKYELREVTLRQLITLERMKIRILDSPSLLSVPDYDLIIDALLGYNQRGDPSGVVGQLVRFANASGRQILALDIPTGLNPDTGEAGEPCIRADQTLTLALPKHGLLVRKARKYVGELFLADISTPHEIYAEFGLHRRSIFEQDVIVRLEHR